jgi:hypothetical protein
MSKAQKARDIFTANAGKSRKEIIQLFVDKLEMSTAGASTYYQNCKKATALPSAEATAKPIGSDRKRAPAPPKLKHLPQLLEEMNLFRTMADKDKPKRELPKTAEECEFFFEVLEGRLSPENLCCDGEASPAQVRNMSRYYNNCWKELEKIAGKKRTQNI